MLKTLHIILMITIYCMCCTSSQSKKRSEASDEIVDKDFYDNLTSPFLNSKDLSSENSSHKKESDARPLISKGTCLKLLKSRILPYRKLATWLPKEDFASLVSPASELARLRKKNCQPKKINATVRVITNALNHHNQKLGIILPLSGPHELVGEQIRTGINYGLEDLGYTTQDKVVFLDSQGNPKRTLHQLAQLVFKYEVSLVVGGTLSQEASALTPWAKHLMIPMVFLSSKVATKSDYIFSIFPRLESLTSVLTEALKLQRIKRVAILTPDNESSIRMSQLLKDSLEAQDIKLIKQVNYKEGHYNSMETAAKTLFEINVKKREAEFRDLVRRKRLAARRAGVRFNPRIVSLPPKIDFDALFIPDNFKNVRHFVKIFQYLGVEDLTLFGNHEWRSIGLIQPFDPFLQGSFFADFVGSYRDLPSSLEAFTEHSEYFVKAEKARTIDLQLIGHRAATTLVDVTLQGKKRKDLHKHLRDLENKNSRYFTKGAVFKTSGESRWPSFVFYINRGNIQLHPPAKKPQVFVH